MRKYQVYLDGKRYTADEVFVDQGETRVFTGETPDLKKWWDDLPLGHNFGTQYKKVTEKHVSYRGSVSAVILVDRLHLHLLREIV